MADREFTLRLGIPKEYPRMHHDDYSCHDSDGLEDCECVGEDHDRSIQDCAFYGHPTEPLAFYLPPFSQVQQQEQCPLYTVLPKEIRDMVWDYALVDDGAPSPGSDNVFRRERGAELDVAKVDSACALLQTCKAVYLETYQLPMLLNGMDSPFRAPRRSLGRVFVNAPGHLKWQYALIQRLDYRFQQVSVEGPELQHQLESWRPILRHSGAYVVAPRFYNVFRPNHRPDGQIAAHMFALTSPSEKAAEDVKDGDKVTLCRYGYETHRTDDSEYPLGRVMVTGKYTARAMVARSLTHLTLRMPRTDWWTWSYDPTTTTAGDRQLALDPAHGGEESRPLVSDMLDLAAKRRAGQHPTYTKTWGAAIGGLPDLKTFELILETFSVKKNQLDTVVDCARTWKFPLIDTACELVCDGNVESMKWAQTAEQDRRGSGHEAMDLDASNAQPKIPLSPPNPFSYPEATHTDQEGEPTQTSGNSQNDQGSTNRESSQAEDGSMPLSEGPASPRYVATSPAYSPAYNPSSPRYSPWSPRSPGYVPFSPRSPPYGPFGPRSLDINPVTPSDIISRLPDEPWLQNATEFDVRIVRFRRPKAD